MKEFFVSVRKYALVPVVLVLALVALGAFALFTPSRAVQAFPAPPSPLTDWIIAVGTTGTVSLVDTATDIIYPAVITSGLGSPGGGLFEIVVVPNSNLALISNFLDATVYFVDFTDRLSPTIVTSVTLGFLAEDIAVTRDGRTALVTDGGNQPYIGVIDVPSRSLAYTVTLSNACASTVDIAPDGTVIVADYYGGNLQALYPDASGVLTQTGSYSYMLTTDGTPVLVGRSGAPGSAAISPLGTTDVITNRVCPVNIAVAPDGQTVFMADACNYTRPEPQLLYAVGICRIVAPGVLSFTTVITNLARSTQSIAFSADGTLAYLSQNGGVDQEGNRLPHALTVIEIVAPGEVRLVEESAAEYPRFVSTQLFGVDTIAVARGKAYIGNPGFFEGTADLYVVNLDEYSVKRLDMPGISGGVAVLSPFRMYVPLVSAVSEVD